MLFQGKYQEAESLNKRSLAMRQKALGPDHPAVAESLNNRAGLLQKQVRVGGKMCKIRTVLCGCSGTQQPGGYC